MIDSGTPIQGIVFFANLDYELSKRMRTRLAKLLDPDGDRIHNFQLCAACEPKTIVMGIAERVEDADFYVI